jgi:CBS domain-containing protein
MRAGNVRLLPVCDRLGNVLGAITDRDIAIRVVAEALPASTLVHEVMRRENVACGAQDELGKAEALMVLNKQLPVICVDELGRLEGLITLSDILKMNGSRFSNERGRCGGQ